MFAFLIRFITSLPHPSKMQLCVIPFFKNKCVINMSQWTPLIYCKPHFKCVTDNWNCSTLSIGGSISVLQKYRDILIKNWKLEEWTFEERVRRRNSFIGMTKFNSVGTPFWIFSKSVIRINVTNCLWRWSIQFNQTNVFCSGLSHFHSNVLSQNKK